MSGPAPSKKEIPARVFIHEKDERTGSKILHIDVESPLLNEIVRPGESTYCGGKAGGVFIGLKREMIKRAEKILGETRE